MRVTPLVNVLSMLCRSDGRLRPHLHLGRVVAGGDCVADDQLGDLPRMRPLRFVEEERLFHKRRRRRFVQTQETASAVGMDSVADTATAATDAVIFNATTVVGFMQKKVESAVKTRRRQKDASSGQGRRRRRRIGRR